jgi:hypothetical protein
VLAETPGIGIDAGALLLGLLAAAVVVGLFVAGFLAAPRAGKGSRPALVVWIVALVAEGLACVGSVLAVVDGELNFSVLIAPVSVGVQVVMFRQARPE